MEPIQEQVKKGFEGIEAKLRAEMEAKTGAELTARIEEALKKAAPDADLKTIREDVAKVKAALGRVGIGGSGAVEVKSLGSMATEHAQYKNLLNGAVPSISIDVPRDLARKMFGQGVRTKGIYDLSTDMPGLQQPERIQPIVPIRRFKGNLRRYLRVTPTSKGSIQYDRQTYQWEVYTELAAATVSNEDTIAVDNANGFYVGQSILIGTTAKVISAINRTTNVITLTADVGAVIAVDTRVTGTIVGFSGEALVRPATKVQTETITVTIQTLSSNISPNKEILDDEPRLEALINAQLPDIMARSEETHILSGGGGTGTLTGILSTSGILTYTMGGSDTAADAFRKAIGEIHEAGYLPNLIVMHPADLTELELLKDSTGQYLNLVTTNPDGTPRLWRLDVLESTAIAENTGLVGDFMDGAELFDREMVNIQIYAQHSDYATRGLVLIQIAERVGLAVKTPNAFCKVVLS